MPLELGWIERHLEPPVSAQGSCEEEGQVENYLAKKVRWGEMSLSEAQAEIQHWETVDTTQ